MSKATYKSAGVDLEIYRESMSRLPRMMHRTFSARVMKLDGGFAGLFRLDFDNPLFRRNYDDPVLVSCTDGVGTKLKVASLCNLHSTVGIDLVAMSVNDAICCGAEPLFFLDYVAMSQDDPDLLEQIVSGISDGCIEADCALLGGETAIMPDLYAHGEYDLAGFCVGVVERKRLITGALIRPDDVILGLASSGLHSNGFSLVRKVVFEIAGLSVADRINELGETIGESLLRPTRIYAKVVGEILRHAELEGAVHGIAHITGGGLDENLKRILPTSVSAVIDWQSWQVPPIFDWIQQRGQIELQEMRQVFNMGVGLVLVVDPMAIGNVETIAREHRINCWRIGLICSG
jgi:phosphoribosylformylglycinamidine cyclo-ligase